MKCLAPLALASAVLAAMPVARAEIVVVAPTATTAGSVPITAPISFTIATAGSVRAFVLDEWITSDETSTVSPLGSSLAYSLNGISSSRVGDFGDNAASSFGSVTPNDGYLLFPFENTLTVTAGDTVTLLAGTYTIAPFSGFNPQATQTFTGSMFLADNGGARLSSNAPVPEPSLWTLTLGGAGLLGLLARRRCGARG